MKNFYFKLILITYFLLNFFGMDPVFNKFKEKLGSFKKALSKTIDR